MVRLVLVASALVIAAFAPVAQTGIPVCDEYFAKVDDCIERLPEISQNDIATIEARRGNLSSTSSKRRDRPQEKAQRNFAGIYWSLRRRRRETMNTDASSDRPHCGRRCKDKADRCPSNFQAGLFSFPLWPFVLNSPSRQGEASHPPAVSCL
jgi:hypothetical protein